ncbi:MAG: acetylglutamate kinase [Dehalococcoidia bacterium]|nr:acetylglutamate kinase [Dehalococcoidia bacterium]
MTQPLVVKVGGSTLGSHDTALEDIAALHAAGRRIIVVHGGGNTGTEWLKIHDIANEFVDGLRVTNADAIDVVTAVFAGLVNKQLVADLRGLGAPAFGLCGVDGGLLETRQLDQRLGFVGEVSAVDARPLETLLDAGYLPVIGPVGFWQDGDKTRLMNVNADTVAGEVAAAVGAAALVFLTDVAYVRDGSGDNLQELRPAEVEGLIAGGAASGGMIPKLRAGARAAEAGVGCSIIDGREAHALRRVLDGVELGTRVTV